MEHQNLCFKDIMQTKMLFYDKSSEAACFDICSYLKIDNLPAVNGKNFFELKGKKFSSKKFTRKNTISYNDRIFSAEAISKMLQNKHNVVFVFPDDVLMGLVHICDYNKNIVLQSIQDDILDFERMIRQLLDLSGYTNNHMIEHFQGLMKYARNERDRAYYD